MAINPSTLLQNLNGPDTDYPYGSAKNSSGLGLKDGTEIKAQVFNDIWGFLHRVLDEASVVPSGNPDTVLVSQYYDALMGLVQDAIQTEISGLAGEWFDIPLETGWTAEPSGTRPFQYRIILGGVAMQIRGNAVGSGLSTTVSAPGSMPSGARPTTGSLDIPVACSSSNSEFIIIWPDGSITITHNSLQFACNLTVPLW